VNNAANIMYLAIATCVLAAVVTELVRRHALRNAILDIPNVRSSHAAPTPRGGGLAIVAAFMSALAWLVFFRKWLRVDVATVLIIGGGAIALAGYLDDRRSLPASTRICIHIAAAILAVVILGGISEQSLGSFGLHGIWVSSLLAIIALTWSTNLFNFMDGIDGIAGSEAIFVAGAGAVINLACGGDNGLTAAMMALGAATLGFLVSNWPPARIFMGDVGSGFLGYCLTVLALAASRYSAIPIEVWAILSGVFLVDATVTLLRRFVRGDRWLEAHRLHAYQILARRWQAHQPTTILVIAINLFWLLPWAWIAASSPGRAMLCSIAALLPLAIAAFLIGAGRSKSETS
jgi:Fuc2NAc and GlcNAc transferase